MEPDPNYVLSSFTNLVYSLIVRKLFLSVATQGGIYGDKYGVAAVVVHMNNRDR